MMTTIACSVSAVVLGGAGWTGVQGLALLVLSSGQF